MTELLILGMAFIQSVSFSMSGRSRNRDNMTYHAFCAIGSNGLWFLTMRELVVADLSLILIIPYITGTVCGSVFGAKISMKIETLIGAVADPKK